MSFRYPSAARRSGKIAPLLTRANGRRTRRDCRVAFAPLCRPGTTGAAMDEFRLARYSFRGRTGRAPSGSGWRFLHDRYRRTFPEHRYIDELLQSRRFSSVGHRHGTAWPQEPTSRAPSRRAPAASSTWRVTLPGRTFTRTSSCSVTTLRPAALLKTIQYSSGNFRSEFASSIVTDAAGSIYITGGTVGDGPDVITVKFDPTGKVLWEADLGRRCSRALLAPLPGKDPARPERRRGSRDLPAPCRTTIPITSW